MKTRFLKGVLGATAFAAVVLCAVAVAQTLSHETIEKLREAVKSGWLRESAENGNAEAQSALAIAYGHGYGVTKDRQEAVRWHRKAAEQGHAPSQFNLGQAYFYGKGVSVDKREGVRWWLKAAEQGDAGAQSQLGVAYLNGVGVAEDKREAVRWIRKAVEQGHADAQYALGHAYHFGKGVAEDKREAARWYRKAAEQGHALAQSILGAAYYLGEGVITDMREAYIWLSIAKANGNEDASKVFSETNWRNDLTQSEIRSAQKEAAQRMEEIDRRKSEQDAGAKTPIPKGNFTLAPEPKGETPSARVFEKTWRSVVVVHNGDNQGSGVIIRPNIVATNCHVVDSGARIIVQKSADRRADTETDFSAEILRADKKKDFCLLKVQNLWGVVATVRKYDTLKIGEKVYALGAPQGLDLSLSEGVISQLRKSRSARFIQTDAAISPGSSGGGLFDRDGNLIGILTSKITGQNTEGLGFAIPADLVLGN